MLPLAAYANRLSVRPGETIRFHVANATDANTTAKIVRVICADANPAGPGIVLSRIDAEPVKLLEPGPQSVPHGSHVRIAGLDRWISGDSFTMVCRVFPTLRSDRDQCIFASNTAQGGFSVSVQADGTLAARTGTGTGVTHAASRPLALRQWHVVWLRHDAAQGRLQLGHARLDTSMMRDPSSSLVEGATGEASLSGRDGTLLLAASGVDAPRDHFNGKLEAPALWDRALLDEELSALAVGAEVAGAVAAWDFAHQADTDRIIDRGSWKLEGVAINTPSRAVTGSTWTGKEMCFRNAPQQYSAIHFHEDDIDDCRWPAAFEWTVPDDTRSAVYALLLEAGVATENVPFHVVPPRGKSTARLAVLASTITYTIYGNHARPEWLNDAQWKADWEQQVSDWGCYPHNPGAHREYGLSTYNMHPDGSGISIASWHRPMLNVRIGFLTYPYPSIRASGLRHFPADSHLIAWLESRDIAYDVITDWELHEEGQALLDHYDVVLTGSHPEYHTPAMIDSLTGYRDGGGRLCYLGGNGFYWKVALAGDRTGVIEIRRGEGGIRAWAAEPGEYYNQFDGEYGGLWRRNARPPQVLTGVGFTAQGNFVGSYYRRRDQASDPRVAWMFAGIDADIIGDHGLSGHGAAGFELDRADKHLGTPEHAVVVASSENHPPDAPWVLVPEEMLTHITTWPGEPASDLIRADMTFFETPAGGAVFSVGSITFCGSLLSNGGDNDVSTLLGNVVRRFLDTERFEMPAD